MPPPAASPLPQSTLIHGTCAPGFKPVRDAFVRNFERRGEIGAAVAVHYQGDLVVDLWGGWRDSARSLPWEADTLVNTQSTTKGVVAALVHRLVERGMLAWDTPVAEVWPEFARKDKAAVTLREVMSHQAGLCVLDAPLPPGGALQWDKVIRALENQRPVWTPGSRFGYHAVTWPFLVGEIVERAAGQSLARVFETEFAAPWKLDFFLGLPRKDAIRTAELLPMPEGRSAMQIGRVTPYKEKAFRLCPPLPGTTINSPEVRAAPSYGFGNARALARLYGGLSCGGILEGCRRVSERVAQTMGETEVEGEDAVLGTMRRFGRGYWLHYPTRNAVRGPRSFGHPGLGGSFAFADPDRQLAVAYVMNLPGAYVRAANIELSVYRSLDPAFPRAQGNRHSRRTPDDPV